MTNDRTSLASVTERVEAGRRLGEYLRSLEEQRPPTLAEIARRAGVSRQRVWRVVHGVQPPSERILRGAVEAGVPAWIVGLATEERMSISPEALR